MEKMVTTMKVSVQLKGGFNRGRQSCKVLDPDEEETLQSDGLLLEHKSK